METEQILRLVVLILLLILSALFSSAETALTTVNVYKMKGLAEQGSKRAALVLKLMENPSKVLSTILIGNNIVNLSASSLTTMLATEIFDSAAVGIATGILTILVLIFGEITPKTLATIYSEQFALFYSLPIQVLSIVLTPVIWILDKLCGGIFLLLGVKDQDKNKQMTESELRTIVNVSHEDGVIEGEEKEMITNVVDFGDSIAKEIMIPRADMVMVSVDASLDELIACFMQEQYSRVPVYEENKENIIGIVHLKDLFFLQEMAKQQGLHKELREIMREPYFTYEYQKTSSIMEELRKSSVSMTIVLDEYGCAAGMITIEDLLEEIVGEIRDEYDGYEADVIKQTAERQYEVDGSSKIDDVNDALDLQITSDDYDSIGGYIIELLDRLPKKGDIAKDKQAIYQVLQADKTRIERVGITILEQKNEE